MIKRYPENIAVLGLAILIAAVGVIPLMSGKMLRNGAPVVVTVFLISKGASTLRCKMSDVALSAAAFIFVLLSKLVPAKVISPVIFQIAALAVVPIFAMTGLSLRAIAVERKRRGPEAKIE